MRGLLVSVLSSFLCTGCLGTVGETETPDPSSPDDTGLAADTRAPTDAAPDAIDTGTTDTGAIDSGATDTGATDSGATDTGAIDTGATDTGAIDAPIGGGFATWVSKTTWEAMFPHRNALFTYEGIVAAAAAYPTFGAEGGAELAKREIAAFLANISHETTGGWDTAPDGRSAWGLYFKEEVGCETGACTGYCDPTSAFKCVAGKTYHGRGPIQLSWNYNYGQAGAALGIDLLAKPELVTSDAKTTFLTALWFWMTPQAPKPSAHAVMAGTWTPSSDDLAKGRKPGFGMTVNIINGGLECGFPTDARVKDRVGFYERYVTLLGTTKGDAVECATMKPY